MKIFLISLIGLLGSPAFASFEVVAPQSLQFAREGSLSVVVRNAGSAIDSLNVGITGSPAFRVSINRCSNVPSLKTCLITVTESLRGVSSSSVLSATLSSLNLNSAIAISSSSSVAASAPASFIITRSSSGDVDASSPRGALVSFSIKNVGGSAGIPTIINSQDRDFFNYIVVLNHCLNPILVNQSCSLSIRIPPQKLPLVTFGLKTVLGVPSSNQEVSFPLISNQPKFISATAGIRTYSDGSLARTCHYYAMSHASGGISGMYRIQPNVSHPAFEVYCDMDLDAAGNNNGFTMAAKAIGGDVPTHAEWQLLATGTNSSIAVDGSRTFKLSDEKINDIRESNAKVAILPNQHISITVFDKSKAQGGPDYSVRFVSRDLVAALDIPFHTNVASAIGGMYISATPEGDATLAYMITFTDVNVGVWSGYVLQDREWNNPYTTVMFPMGESVSCGNSQNNEAHLGTEGAYSSATGQYPNIRCDSPWPADATVYTRMLIR